MAYIYMEVICHIFKNTKLQFLTYSMISILKHFTNFQSHEMCIYRPVLSLKCQIFAFARLASNHIIMWVNDIKAYQNVLQCIRIVLCVCIIFISWSQLLFFSINFFSLCTMDPKYVASDFSMSETKKVRKPFILPWKLRHNSNT